MTTEEIQQEIERTRGEMAGTLQAIENKFSARQLMDQAVDTMRGLTSDQSRLGAIVRDHPIPVALIGLGIGWIGLAGFLGARRSEEQEVYGERESGWSGAGTGTVEYGSPAEAASSGYGAEGTQGFEPMGGVGGPARRGFRKATDYTRQRVSQWSRSAGDMAGGAVGRTRDAYQDQPLIVGAAAVVLGAALGAFLPRTRWEGRLTGGTMDEMVRQARETGGDLMEKAGRVAKSAIRVARRGGEEAAETVH